MRPGLPLAGAISQRLKPGIDVLVLGNHGLVVAANTVADSWAVLSRVVDVLRLPVRALKTPDRVQLSKICLGTDYIAATSDETHALATDELALGTAKTSVFYPDHVVFLGTGVATDVTSNAPLVAIAGVGVAVHKRAKHAVEPMGRCLADVMRRVAANANVLPLSSQEIGSLTNWDAEKYRQNLKL
jgi:rhamnose utilization protein RhaD (predicted bifunctional aldolase and dehydrogenase)